MRAVPHDGQRPPIGVEFPDEQFQILFRRETPDVNVVQGSGRGMAEGTAAFHVKDAYAARDMDVSRITNMLKQGAVGGTGRQRRAHAAYDGFFKQAFPAAHAGING